MEIQQLVGKINTLLEPMSEEIAKATKITQNGIVINTPLLTAIKTAKFEMLCQSIKEDFLEGGQFSSKEEKDVMFKVFQRWFSEYEIKIFNMQNGSEERTCEILFLGDAKEIIENIFI